MQYAHRMKLHFYHPPRSYDCPHQHGNMGPISHLILFPEYACYLQELSVISDIYPILIINNNFFFFFLKLVTLEKKCMEFLEISKTEVFPIE